MTHPSQSGLLSGARRHAAVACVSVVFALLFALAEVTQASQGRFWFGGTAGQWIEAAAGFFLYTVALFLIAEVVSMLLGLASRRRLPYGACAATAGGGAALALWWLLRTSAVDGAQGPGAAVYLAIAGVTALLLVLPALRIVPLASLCAIGAAALLSGIWCVRLVADVFMVDANRAELCASIPAVWACAAALAGIILYALGGMTGQARALRPAAAIPVALLLPATLLWTPWLAGTGRRPVGPNLLLITADAMRADYGSLYGGDTPTPSLESLAARGVVFDRAYTVGPWTVPSLCGMIASKYPPGLTPGAPDEQQAREELGYHQLASYWLDEEGKTLADRLHFEKGYATSAYMGNLAVIFHDWMFKGFRPHVFLDALSYGRRGRLDLFPTLQAALTRPFPRLSRERTIDSTRTLQAYTVNFLRRHRNRSFFLWVHFMDPHTPFDPPDAFRTDFARGMTPPWNEEYPPRGAFVDIGEQLTADQRRVARELYEGEIRYVDHAVGRILRELAALGLEERTYVFFSSDHGEELYDRGRFGHGYSLFEEQLRVPMVAAGPGVAPRRVEAPISHIDLIPTFADLLGVEARPSWRGRSLAGVLRGTEAAPPAEPIFAQGTHYTRYEPEPQQTVITEQHKLIRGLESGTVALYDLDADPGERDNRVQDLPETAARLQSLLDDWAASFPASFGEFAQGDAALRPPTDDVRRLFEDLGYLGPG